MTAQEIADGGVAPIVPTGPKGLPVLGHLLDLRKDAVGFFERSAREHLDVTKLQLGAWPTLLINNSDLIEQVMVKQHEKFIKNRFFWRQLEALLGTGLFTAEGQAWQRQRKLAAPAFATRPLESYAPDMVAMAERMVSTWQDGQELELHAAMMDLGLRIAAKSLLNAEMEGYLSEFEQATQWIIDEIAARVARPVFVPDWVPLPGHIRYLRGVRYIENVVYRVITERRASGTMGNDFLSLLMAARDDEGKPLSDKQLRDEVHNMLLAGYETSAISVSWGFHLLGQHRDIQSAIAEEVETIAAGRPLSHEDISNLTHTEHAVIEIMRLYPPAWSIGREAKEDADVGGYHIPKGTTIFMSPWVTHRDPRYFEDPTAFRPDRWAGDLRRRLPRFAYYPFGGGPRICIGNRFAMMEAMLLVATIARHFDVERMIERPVTPSPSITLRPGGGVWVRLHKRR